MTRQNALMDLRLVNSLGLSWEEYHLKILILYQQMYLDYLSDQQPLCGYRTAQPYPGLVDFCRNLLSISLNLLYTWNYI